MAETSDERWRACQDLGTVGPIIAKDYELLLEVTDRLKDALNNDPSGIVRYYAVLSLGKLCPVINKQRPDMVFDLVNLFGSIALKDDYDRVRRGAVCALGMLGEMGATRLELGEKVREMCGKVLVHDAFDIVRCDTCTHIGKLGPPKGNAFTRRVFLEPVQTAQSEDSSKLVRSCATLALHKMEKEDKSNLEKHIKQLEQVLVTYSLSWSYWLHRESIARALGETGSLLTHIPHVSDIVLKMLEKLADDMVWDVRMAACKAYGNIASVKSATGVAVGIDPKDLREQALPVLRKAANDQNADVREAAQDALKKMP